MVRTTVLRENWRRGVPVVLVSFSSLLGGKGRRDGFRIWFGGGCIGMMGLVLMACWCWVIACLHAMYFVV